MTFDIQPILNLGRAFYKDHGLGDWADALPRRSVLDTTAVDRIAWAERMNWTEAFAFPPFALQMATLDRLVEETARKRAAQLADDRQYTEEPFLADGWTRVANGRVVQRAHDLGPRDGPYLLLFSRCPLINAWGRSCKQIVELLAAKGLRGLTVPEYLALQRFLAERDRHHRFVEPEDPGGRGHHLCLADSADDAAMTVAACNDRGINLQACPLGHRDAKRATVATLVVPL